MKNIYDVYKINYWNKYRNFYKFFDKIGEGYTEDILPIHKNKELEEHKASSILRLKELDFEFNYKNLYDQHTKFFESLMPAKIDGLLLLAFKEIEKNETILSTLNTFNPKSGYSKNIKYNRFKTTTGRLTVKSGPRILTLPSRCRSILKSRFKDGSVFIVDFKSLEPRIARYLSSNSCGEDIYKDIQEKLNIDVDRSVIKRFVISTLYGSRSQLIDSISKEKIRLILSELNKFFDMKKIKDLSYNIDDIGIRRNYYGRPLWNLEETKENVLINNFIQSSAVDLTLNYFYDLTTKLDLESAIPLFVIHDAILFDVKKEYKQFFQDQIEKGYTDNLGKFYLESKEITRREF